MSDKFYGYVGHTGPSGAHTHTFDTRDARIAELEAALRRIYGAVYDPEGMSDANTLDLVLSLSGDALGLPARAAQFTKEDVE